MAVEGARSFGRCRSSRGVARRGPWPARTHEEGLSSPPRGRFGDEGARRELEEGTRPISVGTNAPSLRVPSAACAPFFPARLRVGCLPGRLRAGGQGARSPRRSRVGFAPRPGLPARLRAGKRRFSDAGLHGRSLGPSRARRSTAQRVCLRIVVAAEVDRRRSGSEKRAVSAPRGAARGVNGGLGRTSRSSKALLARSLSTLARACERAARIGSWRVVLSHVSAAGSIRLGHVIAQAKAGGLVLPREGTPIAKAVRLHGPTAEAISAASSNARRSSSTRRPRGGDKGVRGTCDRVREEDNASRERRRRAEAGRAS
jgi:hypothetical protein